MLYRTKMLIVISFCSFLFLTLQAQSLVEERPYEPVIVKGADNKKIFYQLKASDLHLYAFEKETHSWSVMPHQIDEVFVTITDGDTSWSYFDPDTIPSFDSNDELVFLIGDMGDKADLSDWIDHEDAQKRVEIKVADPEDSDLAAYAYLYVSSTLNESIPTPYNFSYDTSNNTVSTETYTVGIDEESGFLKDIRIGNGVDILDTQKFRFVGLMEFGIGSVTFGEDGIPAATEELNLVTINDPTSPYYFHQYTKNPVVRLIREVKSAIRIEMILDEFSFRNEIMFYPYSATLAGGAGLTEEEIKDATGTEEDIRVEVSRLRQSWDLNENAIGSKFYNEANDGILIDGNNDTSVDYSLQDPNSSWTLVSGEFGSFFNYVFLKDEEWESSLYYYDNQNGGQADLNLDQGGDTGDGVSYGDHGISLYNPDPSNFLDLTLELNAYFVDKEMSKEDGEKLFEHIQSPVRKVFELQTKSASVVDNGTTGLPKSLVVDDAYPNPFNSSTQISYTLEHAMHLSLLIMDVTGRTVAILANEDQCSGRHLLQWNGLDDKGSSVSSGLYFLVVRTNNIVHSQKLMYIR